MPQIAIYRMCSFLKIDEIRSIASPGTRLRAHSCCCACPHAHPLPLQHAALLRVSLFAQTRLRRSGLRHHQEPGRVRIRVAVRAPPPCAPPPTAARGPAEGYFTLANLSTAILGAHPPPKWCAQVRAFASFHRIAQARVCAPFRYRSRVRTGREIPQDMY